MSDERLGVSGQSSAVSGQRLAGSGQSSAVSGWRLAVSDLEEGLAAFCSAEGVSLSGAERDELLLQMRLYLMNELHELAKMIAWMEGQKKKIEALLAELP